MLGEAGEARTVHEAVWDLIGIEDVVAYGLVDYQSGIESSSVISPYCILAEPTPGRIPRTTSLEQLCRIVSFNDRAHRRIHSERFVHSRVSDSNVL